MNDDNKQSTAQVFIASCLEGWQYAKDYHKTHGCMNCPTYYECVEQADRKAAPYCQIGKEYADWLERQEKQG